MYNMGKTLTMTQSEEETIAVCFLFLYFQGPNWEHFILLIIKDKDVFEVLWSQTYRKATSAALIINVTFWSRCAKQTTKRKKTRQFQWEKCSI